MKLQGFDILEKLDESPIATVWKATQVSLKRTVVITLLKPELVADQDELALILDEARSAAKLSHNNAIQIYDVGEQDGLCFFVVEHIDGTSVRAMLEPGKPIEQDLTLRIAQSVAEVLHIAWTKERIVHRTINPGNIMIHKDGTVKVANLGLSRIVDPTRILSREQAQQDDTSPYYLAPEQAQGEGTVGCRSDMYSLGATLYHMFTGHKPFEDMPPEDAPIRHINDYLPSPKKYNSRLSVGTVHMLTRLMMKAPEDRYREWSDVIQEIQRIASGRIFVPKTNGDAVSTIGTPSISPRAAAPPKAATRPAKSTTTRKTKPPRTAEQTAAKIAKYVPKKKVSLAFRLSAWLILALGLAALRLFLLHPGPGDDQEVPGPPPPPQPTPRAGAVVRATPMPVSTTLPDSTGLSTPLSAEEMGELDAFSTELAEHVFGADLEGACRLIAERLDQPHSVAMGREFQTMSDILDAVSSTRNAVNDAIREKIGAKVSIRLNGRKLVIMPRAMAGGQIDALRFERDGATVRSNAFTFAVTDLSPTEQSRWLGKPDSPAKCAMKFALYMRAKRYGPAKTLAARCGPFANAFVREAEAREDSQNEE